MKRVYVAILACLLSVAALGDVRGIPMGSSEVYVAEAEQAELASRAESGKDVDGEKLGIIILEYRDVIFGNPARVKYFMWQDKLYAVNISIIVGDAEERQDVFDIITVALEDRHGKSTEVYRTRLWLVDKCSIGLSSDGHEILLRYNDNNIVNDMKRVAKEQKEQREKKEKEKMIENHKDDLEKI